MKRETLEQAHEADVARGVGFDPYTLRHAPPQRFHVYFGSL